MDYFCKKCGEKLCSVVDDLILDIGGEQIPFRRNSDWVVCSCGMSYMAAEIRSEAALNNLTTHMRKIKEE